MANRYFVAGGVDNNWGTTGNWSLTSGGAGGRTVPTASDAVFLDANSPSCTIDTSARVALSLDFTGYTNTITMSQQLTVSGFITLAAGMTVAGTGYLVSGAAGTLTSNGKAWKNLDLINIATRTLADAWTVDNLKSGNSSSTITANGFSITTLGDFNRSAASGGHMVGTTVVVMGGTGSIVNATTTGYVANPVTFNTSGTITLPTGNWNCLGEITYTAGTVDASGCDLNITGGTNVSLNTGGNNIAFRSITIGGQGTYTYTLSSELHTVDAKLGQTTRTSSFNGSAIVVSGDCGSPTLTSGIVDGTSLVQLVGTGDFSCPSVTTGRISLAVEVDTSGTITIAETSGNINLGAWTLTAGTLVIDGKTFLIGQTTPAAADVRYGVDRGNGLLGDLQIPNSGTPTGTQDATSDACVVSGKKYGSPERTGSAAGGAGGIIPANMTGGMNG